MKSGTACNNNYKIKVGSVIKDFKLSHQTIITHGIPEYPWNKGFLLLQCHGIELVFNTLKISYS